ncbi:DUF4333 domain-containing protein [Calidifontibacter indicus]|uniref:Uncharacterized protein DUF4333 n=1 Tax=Calidifontibacter indicus TaxID=419650 RepID=A0A3D9UL98_9MICO|nr:DUF4333 domain-containing protein [Calidifontibacter indicus]REF29193.1 uncharacterized protein DUF4333 [Calidifontibacter indicus]
MTSRVRRGAAAALTSALLIGGVTACSSEAAVKKSDVEKQIESRISSSGTNIKDVKCDDNLKAKKGATTDCEAKVDGTTQKFKATVTSVDGKTVHYSISKG